MTNAGDLDTITHGYVPTSKTRRALQQTKQYLKDDFERTRERHPRISNAIAKTSEIYKEHKVVNLNVNMLATNVPSFAAAGAASAAYQALGLNHEQNAIATAVTEFATYMSIFTAAHYKANKHKFTDDNGDFDKKKFWTDYGRLLISAVPTTVLFYNMTPRMHDAFMEHGLDAGPASQLAYWGGSLIVQGIYTSVGMWAGLFADNPGEAFSQRCVKTIPKEFHDMYLMR